LQESQTNIDSFGLSSRDATLQWPTNDSFATRFEIKHSNDFIDAGFSLGSRDAGRQFELGRVSEPLSNKSWKIQ
jgi:hypothetical protein